VSGSGAGAEDAIGFTFPSSCAGKPALSLDLSCLAGSLYFQTNWDGIELLYYSEGPPWVAVFKLSNTVAGNTCGGAGGTATITVSDPGP
jgi:hypothetical protein